MLSAEGNMAAAQQAVCRLNGQVVPCGEIGNAFAQFAGIGLLLFFVFAILSIVGFIFWLFMLIHAASKPIEHKVAWVVIIAITGLIGAILYYFMVKRSYYEILPSNQAYVPPAANVPPPPIQTPPPAAPSTPPSSSTPPPSSTF